MPVSKEMWRTFWQGTDQQSQSPNLWCEANGALQQVSAKEEPASAGGESAPTTVLPLGPGGARGGQGRPLPTTPGQQAGTRIGTGTPAGVETPRPPPHVPATPTPNVALPQPQQEPRRYIGDEEQK